MKYILLILAVVIYSAAYPQDTASIKKSHESPHTLQANKHMVFARTPVKSNNPGNASQTFKGDDFIYGRVFFTQPLKDALFLEKNEEGTIPVDVFVEDLTNHSSLYIAFDLTEKEMNETFFDFDILPDPDHTMHPSKQFETGRFSYFLKEAGLEKKNPVFKFTVGDATGYIQVDFSGVNLQQVKDRDYQAYQKAHVVKEGEEKE